MILNKIEDPRSNLEKARRYDLLAFAKQNGIDEITENMPAVIMRKILRSKGKTNIVVHQKPLGAAGETATMAQAPSDAQIAAVDADDDLMRQYAAQTAPRPAPGPAKTLAQMSINELREECKRLGIKLGRRDNMITMKAKIEDHGKQDPA